MKYIGLDCHKQYDHATMIDTETGEIKAKRLAHIKDEFSEFIGDRSGIRMVIESCRDWSRTFELSEDFVEEIILAHPLKLKAIASAKIKTDTVDSQTSLIYTLVRAEYNYKIGIVVLDCGIKDSPAF